MGGRTSVYRASIQAQVPRYTVPLYRSIIWRGCYESNTASPCSELLLLSSVLSIVEVYHILKYIGVLRVLVSVAYSVGRRVT